jgi:hypothetical protein
MRTAITILFWLLLLGIAAAQSPLNGTPCVATGSTGAVTVCKSGWSYGCTASTTNTQLLATDGNRTSIQFQNTGATAITLTFGDTAISTNGFLVQPGNSYLWSNMAQGNTPGRVGTASVSIITTSGSDSCVVMFTD